MYTRICPSCQKELTHTTMYRQKLAIKRKTLCNSCANKIKFEKYREKYLKALKNSVKTGEDHHWYGKKHSKNTLEKMKKSASVREYTGKFGKDHHSYGQNLYSIWLEKYGKEEADKRMKEKKRKNSLASSGKNNPMYGKPIPVKSGRGICGWFKGVFFRSIKELSFIVEYLETNNLKWDSCENIGLRIKYKIKKIDRTYTPDFLIEGKKIIEIKPKRLQNTSIVKLKTKAAIKYCKINNLEFEILDFDFMSLSKIKQLENSGAVIFTEKSKERIKKGSKKGFFKNYDRL